MEIKLNPWEFKACVDVANQRLVVSETAGLNHASTYKRDYLTRMQQEILGACGEMAVCKALGKFWSPSVNTFHGVPDIEPNIEVRTTDREDGSLIVRDNDAEDRWYFLVVGSPPVMKVVGAIKGADARKDKWIRDPHGHRSAWFVPQESLQKGRLL